MSTTDYRQLDRKCRELEERVKTLTEDKEWRDQRIRDLELEVESHEINNDHLASDILALQDYIRDLEIALAEAHLMSQPNDSDDKN